MRHYDNDKDVPPHIRAAWTPAQSAFFERYYFKHPTGLGPEWATAHRCIEMLRDIERRDFFLQYWPDEALQSLEGFKRDHYDAEPDKGYYANSSVAHRVRKAYPELFVMHLRPRIQPLEYVAGTHPKAYRLFKEFQKLDTTYHQELAAATKLTSDDPNRTRRTKRLHELYRQAFEHRYLPLQHLLVNLADTH